MIPLIKELKAPIKIIKKKTDTIFDDPEEKEELEIEVCIIKIVHVLCTPYSKKLLNFNKLNSICLVTHVIMLLCA